MSKLNSNAKTVRMCCSWCCCCEQNSDSENTIQVEEEQPLLSESSRPTLDSSEDHRENDLHERIRRKYGLKPTKHRQPEEQSTSQIALKISFTIRNLSEEVKIFAIEAANVMPMLKEKFPDVESGDELILIQIRTKHLTTKARGQSRKISVYQSSVTGALKFSNDCIQTMTVSEFEEGQIRFRLYNVFRRKNDVLLGEYILDIPSLNLDVGKYRTTSYDVIMELHESGSEQVRQPKVLDLRSRMRERMEKNMQSSQDYDLSLSPVHKSENSGNQSNDKGGFQDLFKSAQKRTEGVSKLLDTTEDLKHGARNLRDAAVEIRKRKQKKYGY